MKYVQIEGSKKLSSFIKPMMAVLSDDPAFDHPDWLFEIKWDGYRAVAEITKTGNRLYSRNGLSFDKAYPKVFEELNKIKKEVVLDGEIVVLDEHGKPSFQKLQYYKSNNKYAIVYYIFDCLSIEGKSIERLPLIERKALVQKLLPKSNTILYCDHVEEQGKAFFDGVVKMNMEGIIAKRASSVYIGGKRSSDWLKIKHQLIDEAIIIGFTEGKGSRKYFGALVLAAYRGKKLTYIGHVGTGYTEAILKDVHGKLKGHIRKTSPVEEKVPINAPITWVDPVYLCNVRYTEITDEGLMRHPVFLGLRVDKKAR